MNDQFVVEALTKLLKPINPAARVALASDVFGTLDGVTPWAGVAIELDHGVSFCIYECVDGTGEILVEGYTDDGDVADVDMGFGKRGDSSLNAAITYVVGLVAMRSYDERCEAATVASLLRC